MKRGKGCPRGTVITRYTIWDGYTDELVCLDATAEEARKATGMKSKGSFYSQMSRSANGTFHRWVVEKKAMTGCTAPGKNKKTRRRKK